MIAMNPNRQRGPWYTRPLPGRWHICRMVQVQELTPATADHLNPELIGRCACGGVYWMQRKPRTWTEKNSRRRQNAKLYTPEEEM